MVASGDSRMNVNACGSLCRGIPDPRPSECYMSNTAQVFTTMGRPINSADYPMTDVTRILNQIESCDPVAAAVFRWNRESGDIR